MKKLDLAYIAGLIDGEGYIGIKKSPPYKCQGKVSPSYHARIQIRMVNEAAIKFISETLGGWYYKEKPSVTNGRPLFCYQASDKSAEVILKTIRPHLRVKDKSADTVLALRALQANSRKHQTKITGYRTLKHWAGKPVKVKNVAHSDEYLAKCESFYLLCKTINRTGV